MVVPGKFLSNYVLAIVVFVSLIAVIDRVCITTDLPFSSVPHELSFYFPSIGIHAAGPFTETDTLAVIERD